jgi:hypothetical protein
VRQKEKERKKFDILFFVVKTDLSGWKMSELSIIFYFFETAFFLHRPNASNPKQLFLDGTKRKKFEKKFFKMFVARLFLEQRSKRDLARGSFQLSCVFVVMLLFVNIISVKSPAGVGFSFSKNPNDYINVGDARTANDTYTFLQTFFRDLFPQYEQNKLYLTGESYGGHYVPNSAARILDGNSNNEGLQINLKGIFEVCFCFCCF